MTGSAGSFGKITRSADFERVLGLSSCARSAHFAIHHVNEPPSRPLSGPKAAQLSTAMAPASEALVEKPVGRWFGMVVPKRHARRSVTRSLLKRQIRVAVNAQSGLRSGLWVIRLRAPFDKKLFPSAASSALARVAAAELAGVLAQAVAKTSV